MKAIRQSDSVLVIENKGLGIGMLAFGLIFLISGLVSGAFFGQSSTLRCSREWMVEPCKVERTLMGFPITTIPMRSLSFARVDESEDSDGDTTYRVMLVTREGEVPLTSYYTSRWKKREQIATQVNAFLEERNQRTLEVTEGGTLGLIFGALFAAAGGGIMLWGISYLGMTWTFDKGQGLVSRTQNKWGRWDTVTYPLDQVVGAEVDESSDSDGTTYRVVLSMASGESVPLTSVYSSGWKSKHAVATEIQTFLSLPERNRGTFWRS